MRKFHINIFDKDGGIEGIDIRVDKRSLLDSLEVGGLGFVEGGVEVDGWSLGDISIVSHAFILRYNVGIYNI